MRRHPVAPPRHKRSTICVIAALPRHAADGASASSRACCCAAVRLVLSTVPPNLAISGNTRSWLVLRAMTKSAEPAWWDGSSYLLDPLVVDAVIGRGVPARAPVAAPTAMPARGTRKIKPKMKPHIAPPAAAAPGQAGALVQLQLAVLGPW